MTTSNLELGMIESRALFAVQSELFSLFQTCGNVVDESDQQACGRGGLSTATVSLPELSAG